MKKDDYLNSQKYSECQLVTAINAAIYLNEHPVLQESIEYERLVDLVHARNGAAIGINNAHRYLRLQESNIDNLSLSGIKKLLDNNHPINVTIFHIAYGTHSALIVDYNETNDLRVLNLSELTTDTWIKWTELKKHLTKNHTYLGLNYK